MQGKPRILIFDSEPVFAALLARGLSQHGYNAKVFYTPNEVLTYDTAEYDHAILGATGQEMDGFEMARRLWQKKADLQICFTSIFEIDANEAKSKTPNLKSHCLVRLPIPIEAMAKHIDTHHVKKKDFGVIAQA